MWEVDFGFLGRIISKKYEKSASFEFSYVRVVQVVALLIQSNQLPWLDMGTKIAMGLATFYPYPVSAVEMF